MTTRWLDLRSWFSRNGGKGLLGFALLASLLTLSCQGLLEDSGSYAIVEGYVYADASMTRGVPGVEVIVESDENSQNPYQGPDLMTFTDSTGYFSIKVFLTYEATDTSVSYHDIADVSVYYNYRGRSFRYTGVSVHVGGVYRLPAVYLGMFE